MDNHRPPTPRRDHGEVLYRPGVKPAAAVVATAEISPAHKPRPKRRRKKKKSQADWGSPAIAGSTVGNGPSQGGPVMVLGGGGQLRSPIDVSCTVSECDSGIALDDDDNNDDHVAAEGFVIEMMDPTDPRVALPVPERNIVVTLRDPGHERLSWTACYDDDCRIHLSDKNASGWFPSNR